MTRFLLYSLGGAALVLLGCGLGPEQVNSEYRNSWIILRDYFYFQEKLPPNPGDYPNSETLYASVRENYTRYYAPSESEQILDLLENRRYGLGIRFDSTAAGFLVTAVFAHSPAEAGEILKGDIIIQVEDVSVVEASYATFIENLQGEKGDARTLKVDRKGEIKTLHFILGEYIAPTVFVDTLSPDIALITLTSFVGPGEGEGSHAEFTQALKLVNSFPYTLLDLRENGGGEIGVTLKIAGELIADGTPIAHVEERYYNSAQGEFENKTDVWKAEGSEAALLKKFHVLVGPHTASAAEILMSGLITGRPDVLLIGQKSYGKGRGQVVVHDPPFLEGVAKVTYSLISMPNGFAYDSVGIDPHVVIDDSQDALETTLSLIAEEDSSVVLAKRGARSWHTEPLKTSFEPWLVKRVAFNK